LIYTSLEGLQTKNQVISSFFAYVSNGYKMNGLYSELLSLTV